MRPSELCSAHGEAEPPDEPSAPQVSFWLANRTVGLPLLDNIDYSCIFEEPSALEQTYAIFANVLDLDADGNVLNAKHAECRAAQFIRSYVDPDYTVEPPFEDWEVALH